MKLSAALESSALESSEVLSGKPMKIRRRLAAALLILSAAMLTAYLLSRGALNPDVEAIIIPTTAWSRDISADGYVDGAPVGGLGAGSVTWRLDGSFYNGRLDIGRNDMEVDENCGFYMYQKPSGGVAAVNRLDAASLGPDQAKYYSLFPKSWVDYYGSSFTCKARVTQFSPIIPENYKLSSYPTGIYNWEVTNPTDQPCEVSIMFTWENDFGGKAVIPAADEDGTYRDWAATGKSDAEFLEYCWTPVQKAMEKVKSQDADGDGLPDSSGVDQTYDNMSLTGGTAYCGGLFLAACEAAREIALAMGDEKLANTYDEWLETGRKSYEARLWNGSYYNIDTAGGDPHRIMSDQLCGQWYAVACGLPGIVPESNAKSAFQKIYDYNFKQFDNGAHGIVNVMLPSGEIDNESSQSSECWVGTSWGVVAGMLQQGMTEQAEEIGQSLYNTIWEEGQLWFRTPEAWQTDLTMVRSPYYMRATAVWAVKQAYDTTVE